MRIVTAMIRVGQDQGILVKIIEGLYYHHDTMEEAKRIVAEYIRSNGSMTVSQFRDITGSSRKYALPIMEYFDSIRFYQAPWGQPCPGDIECRKEQIGDECNLNILSQGFNTEEAIVSRFTIRRAHTLVEALIVIAILIILAALIYSNMARPRRRQEGASAFQT